MTDTTWRTDAHPRDQRGRWTETSGRTPERTLPAVAPTPSAGTAVYRRAPIPPCSAIFVDDEGEDQTCSCGNSTRSGWWAAGDATGTPSLDAVGSADCNTTIICPHCGLVFRMGDTELGKSTPPIARFDITDDAFSDALEQQHWQMFGGPR